MKHLFAAGLDPDWHFDVEWAPHWGNVRILRLYRPNGQGFHSPAAESGILLPQVCRSNARKGANTDRQKSTGVVLLKQKDVKPILAKADALSEKPDLGGVSDLLIRELGIPRTLEAIGVTPNSFKILAANSLSDL